MLQEFIQRQKEQYLYEITSLGGNVIYFLISSLFLILGYYNIFLRLFSGIVLVYIIVTFIKIFYFKNRPEKYKYTNFIEKIDASAFPSVHATRSTFLAAVLVNYFGNMLISVILVVLVLLVVYSRIELKKHDVKDVAVGIVLGVLVYFAINFIY